MQRRILRATLVAVIAALTIVTIPALVVAISWQRRLALVALVLLAAAIGYVVARRAGRQISAPIEELTGRAESAGEGTAIFQPMRSGIDEIDRLSQVFERRAGELSRRLASEREFASDASHQLRTPLTALLIRLEEISMTDDLDFARDEATTAIAQVERLTAVVDELLGRARTSPGGPVEPVSLDAVIAAMQREWQPAFATARRSIHVFGERGLWVLTTPTALSQIFSTLLENALQHGRGTVELMARHSGPSVVIEVSDKGEGVDPSIAARVFERRVSTRGSGLGLALARDLATASGGRLELRSMQPAVFALFLSATEPPEGAASRLPGR
ncbi:HAMP domain-containing histidine kinase [Calidifontibacter sp. DB0510]|uniref:histidine kinase n=1 Tax=Metallococcus carri TaxID=1656884 RepID=A0A967AXN0_9MICO|nr:HAMP domain-containing sensor histidine kinase [Metallococcus carri]NHN54623.1 HAMP domain-containing histidine kinase [Metallococcus carri]NOP36538.1 HAMP domain-containing histidine kinase [Calidifontibacter sp. DB2511S]